MAKVSIIFDKYVDVHLNPKNNQIDICFPISGERIDTITAASFQDGFPGWDKDFFIIEDWALNFIDREMANDTFLSRAKEIKEELKEKTPKRYSNEWRMKIYIQRVLDWERRKAKKKIRMKISEGVRRAFSEKPLKERRSYYVSDYTRRKQSYAHTGKKLSEKHRKAISEGLKGRKFSEETLRKMSEAAKNREHQRGENHHKAKLTEDKVVQILEEYYNGEEKITQTQLAKKYKVSPITISRIIRGIAWTHITQKYVQNT